MASISRSSINTGGLESFQREFEVYKEATDTKIKELLHKVKDLESIDTRRDAFGRFQFKDVIFNGTAHADTEITHDLNPADPDDVRYIPVGFDFLTLPVDPPYIYKNGAANARSWGAGYIILRCNIASAVVRMLLVTEAR